MPNYLITIIGPTAIGKTSLSVALAKKFGCDIISCDSRQFYKEMRIGTAVPSKEELDAANHHFVQNISIHEMYSVGQFEKDVLQKLDELFTQNKIQIMVGGSGLYVDAVLKGLDNFPEVNPEIRTQINTIFEQYGITYLQEKLKELDFTFYNKILKENPQTLQNPQRMKRFVEVCLATGLPYSSFLNKNNTSRNFTPIIIGLQATREIIYNRINQRVDIMIQEGLVEEVQKLLPFKENNALQTVGYREIFDYLENKITLQQAIENIKTNTRRFAKRQMTWFNKTENVQWFDYHKCEDNVIKYIKKITN
jgi:tRNA dimethylallyltransferase